MERVDAWTRYWRVHPPVHVSAQMIGVFLGIKGLKPEFEAGAEPQSGLETLEDLRGMFPAGISAEDLQG